MTLKKKLIIAVAAVVLFAALVALVSYLLTDGWWNNGGDEIYTDLDGASIYVFAKDNPTLPFDVKVFISEGVATVFTPGGTDLSRICYTLFDEDGEETGKFTVDLSSGKTCKGTCGGEEIVMQARQATLPTVSVTTIGENTIEDVFADKYKKTVSYGDMEIYVPDELCQSKGWDSVYKTENATDSDPGSVRFKGRGHSSWMYLDKKSLSVKSEEGFSPLGLDKNRDFVLISNHYDRSLIRNAIMYDLYAKLTDDYSVEYRDVHLFVNGEYYGMYLLTQKVEVANDRVDITDLEEKNEDLNGKSDYGNSIIDVLESGATVKYWPKLESPKDVTGGYLIEIDLESRGKSEKSYVKTSYGTFYVIKSPEYISYDEAMYISGYLQDMEDAIHSPTGKNSKGKHYSEYVDIESLAMIYVLDEISMNIDGGRTSSYFYKDSDSVDGMLYRGPIWDYDLALGNYKKYAKPENMEVITYYCFEQLMMHDDFRNEVKKQYNKISPMFHSLINEGIQDKVDSLITDTEMNFTRWNDIFGITLGVVSHPEAGRSYHGAVDYLEEFLETRIKWLDRNFFDEIDKLDK